VLQPRADRCYVAWQAVLEQYFSDQLDPWMLGIHKHKPLGKPSAVRGWREPQARWAVQVILHYTTETGRFFEIDFDLGNPGWAPWAMAVHAVEVINNLVLRRKTNPWAVARARGWEAARDVNATV
jgi:hypothetical protein